MNKKLIVIRHAHRDTTNRKLDNGLSKKGWQQVTEIDAYWYDRLKGKNPVFLSSPKRRCVETISSLAGKLDGKIEIEPLLNEIPEEEHEVEGRLERQVKDFKHWWMRKGPALLVISTHGDWIPSFFYEIVHQEVILNKGKWVKAKYKSNDQSYKVRIKSEFGKITITQ